jgi:hypothetical protein
MDKFFKAIGNFFKRIWQWIKNTAWVQPLLIVVIIFLIIFSFSSNSPLMTWIKDLSNPDDTGEFYKDHGVWFTGVFKDVYSSPRGGVAYNYKEYTKPNNEVSGDLLKGRASDDYTIVLFVENTSMEQNAKNFYDRVLTSKVNDAKSHFYVVDFTDKNKNVSSKWDENNKKWIDDSSATLYDYMFEKLSTFYNSEEYNTYAEGFASKMGYSAKNANIDVWDAKGVEPSDIKSALSMPIAVLFGGEDIVDIRIAKDSSSTFSSTDYPTNKTVSDQTITILSDMYDYAKNYRVVND